MHSEIRLRAVIFVLVAAGLIAILGASWVRAQNPGHGTTWLHSAPHTTGHTSAGTSKKHKKD